MRQASGMSWKICWKELPGSKHPLNMSSGMKTMHNRRLNKEFDLKFPKGYRRRYSPEEEFQPRYEHEFKIRL